MECIVSLLKSLWTDTEQTFCSVRLLSHVPVCSPLALECHVAMCPALVLPLPGTDDKKFSSDALYLLATSRYFNRRSMIRFEGSI